MPGALAISSDDPARISFARREDQKYDRQRRTVLALSKYLGRHLPRDAPRRDYWVDTIGSAYAGRIICAADFAELRGSAIREAYGAAVGGRSCMTDDESQAYLEMYCLNPDRVSMLVFRQTSARALVWKTDEGTIVLDRLYSDSDATKTLVKKYAIDRGWVIRSNDRPGFPGWTDRAEYTVSDLVLPDSRFVPWQDSFRWGSLYRDSLTISSHGCGQDLQCQHGGPYGENRIVCESCECSIHEDDCRSSDNGESYCGSCFDDLFGWCGSCECECPIDDMRSTECGESLCDCCYDDQYTSCEQCDSETGTNDIVCAPIWQYGRIQERYVCQDCADEHSPECCECGDRAAVSTMTDSPDGQLCSDCVPDVPAQTVSVSVLGDEISTSSS